MSTTKENNEANRLIDKNQLKMKSNPFGCKIVSCNEGVFKYSDEEINKLADNSYKNLIGRLRKACDNSRLWNNNINKD